MKNLLAVFRKALTFLLGENTTVKGRKWNQAHQNWQMREQYGS
jgi:hypothetical protein